VNIPVTVAIDTSDNKFSSGYHEAKNIKLFCYGNNRGIKWDAFSKAS
jgi:hypothetical protein